MHYIVNLHYFKTIELVKINLHRIVKNLTCFCLFICEEEPLVKRFFNFWGEGNGVGWGGNEAYHYLFCRDKKYSDG